MASSIDWTPHTPHNGNQLLILRACQKGELETLQQLRLVESEDLSRANSQGETPMHKAALHGHLSLCQWLYSHGAAATVSRVDNYGITPLFMACGSGHLLVCQWLAEVCAAEDLTKANHQGYTPLFIACHQGHLSVCQWLVEAGAAGDTRRATHSGATPMFIACKNGHLSVCEWLFESGGAAADIAVAKSDGVTPMSIACQQRHLSVCKWLIFKGALNVDPAATSRDAPPASWKDALNRPVLLTWARSVTAAHETFFHVVLRASVILPAQQEQPHAGLDGPCLLPLLPRSVLVKVGGFIGVENGRRLRNVREFAEALGADLNAAADAAAASSHASSSSNSSS
jgi:ankyrin repeat protein